MHKSAGLLWAVLFAAAAGCRSNQPAAPPATVAGEFHRIAGSGIQNFYLLGGFLYSGSAPEGEEGFATLQRLGIKSILTVDGATPEVELAAKHGMRYVHLPIGYDGTSRSNALRIVKAAQVLPGPLFVHCHHGMHRGPTAAALICQGLQGWSADQAQAWLQAAGTATNYPGLYRTVREFDPPGAAELRAVSGQFVARAQTPDLVHTMVQVDGHFDALKAMEKAAFKASAEHPDATAASESLLLWEAFREAHRTGQGAERGEAFRANLLKAADTAEHLHLALKDLDANPASGTAPAEDAFQAMTKSCAACHKAYRN